MKLRHLLVAAAAAVFTLASCEEEENLGPASISIDGVTEIELPATESTKTVTFTSTRDWMISSKPDWVHPDITKGPASTKPQTVNLTFEANGEYNREGVVVFTIGLAKAPFKVYQAGENGEYIVPTITCAEFIEKADPNTEYRLVGTVASAVNTSYCSFDLNDGTATVSVWTVNNKDEWKDVVKKGGTVTVRGKYTLYENNGSTKHEMIDAYIESFEEAVIDAAEPAGAGTAEDPYNVAAAVQAAQELTWTSTTEYQKAGPFYIKGKVSAINENFDAVGANGTKYGNATFDMVDEGHTQTFTCFRILHFGNKKWVDGQPVLSVDDEVVICAEIMNYRNDTPETVQNSAYLYSLNGEKGQEQTGAEPSGTGTLEDPYNVAAACEQASDLTWTSNTDYQKAGPFYIKGTVSSISDNFGANEFGNSTFVIVDKGYTQEFTCYRILYLGNKKWVSGQTALKAEDEVVICAEIMNYRNNTPETVQNSAYLYSLNGETGEQQGGDEYGQPAGAGTAEDPYNVAAAVQAAQELTWTSTTEYQKAGPFYIKGKVSAINENFDAVGANGTKYGNATFDMVDEGHTQTFTCFRILHFGNKKWVDGQPVLSVDDEVVICAEIMNYRNDTPETVQNSAYLYSLNGEKGQEQTGAEPSGTGTLEDPYNVAAACEQASDLTWTSNTDYQKAGPFYIKGTVSSISDNFGANEFGNSTFVIVDKGYTQEFTCYRILYLGNKKWVSGQTALKAEDEVVICAEIMNYRNNTPETVQNSAYLYSLNGETGEQQGGDETMADPIGDGSLDNPFNVAGAINAVANLGWTDNQTYDKVGPFYVKGKVGTITDNFDKKNNSGQYYGNATFTMVDEGYTATFTAYRILYLGNKKWEEGQDILAADDEVIVCGELMNYKGKDPNVPETVQGSAYLYSLNGSTTVETKLVISSFKITATGFSAAWNNIENASYTYTISDVTGSPAAMGTTNETSVAQEIGSMDLQWAIQAWEPGATYTLEVAANVPGATQGYTATATAKAPSPTGEAIEIKLDFRQEAPSGLPTGSSNKATGVNKYTWEGYEFTLSGSSDGGYYWNTDGYVLIGKQNAYILLPAIDGKKLTSIAFETGKNASTAVIVDVHSADGNGDLNVNTTALNKDTAYTWELTETEAGVQYRIQVETKHNAQFKYLNLKYE